MCGAGASFKAAAVPARLALNINAQLAANRLQRTLPHGLTVAQFSVLNWFVRVGTEATPGRLARAFQVTKGGMTYTLQQLEELKYVKIEADPADARAKIVRLTKAGVRGREDAIRRVDPGMRALIDALGADAFAGAMPFLVKLRQVLDAARD